MRSGCQNVVDYRNLRRNRLNQGRSDFAVLVQGVWPGPMLCRMRVMHSLGLNHEFPDIHVLTQQYEDLSHTVIVEGV